MYESIKNKTSIIEVFDNARNKNTYVKVCAPMVRYSKLQFRTLVRRYGVDICFTPMIMADSFCYSSQARAIEFTTSQRDTPLIVQYAAKRVDEFIGASQLVYTYADGVDLNCGCPQKWAMKDGYGCSLLSNPELIYQLVREVKNTLPLDFSVSVKLRILKNLKETINLCQQIEKCGVTFITVHGRTPSQKSSENVSIETLSEINKSVHIPLICNGGIKKLSDADKMFAAVKCNGIMAASGLLTNPTLFTGSNVTKQSCINDWYALCKKDRDRMTFQTYHHHLVFMLDKLLNKKQKNIFNYLNTRLSVDKYLQEQFHIDKPINTNLDNKINCQYADDVVAKYKKTKFNSPDAKYSSENSAGKYFSSLYANVELCDLDHMDGSLFDES